MSAAMNRSGFGALIGLLAGLVAVSPAESQSASRPNYAQAQAAFGILTPRDHNEIFLELMATGDFNAMASGQFGGRLYDAIASFQSEHGLEPNGIVTPETLATLNAIGGRIFNSWGFAFLDHPFAAASLAVPGRFGLDRRPTQHGFALENRNHSMSVDFAVFPDSEASLGDIYDRLTRPAPGRRVDMKVIRPTFFAIAGGSDTTGNYSRYIVVPGGIVGFTASWNVKALPNGNRVAVVMANELYPRRMVAEAGRSVDLFDIDPEERQGGSDHARGIWRQAGVDDDEEAAAERGGRAVRAQQVGVARVGDGDEFVIGIEHAVFVEKAVHRAGDTHAAFGGGAAEAGFEQSGVGGVHLQADVTAGIVRVPALHRPLPAEIPHAHAGETEAADMVFVVGALGAEIEDRVGVGEDADGGDVIVLAVGLAGGDVGGADQAPVLRAVGASEHEVEALDAWLAVDDDDELGLVDRAVRLGEQGGGAGGGVGCGRGGGVEEVRDLVGHGGAQVGGLAGRVVLRGLGVQGGGLAGRRARRGKRGVWACEGGEGRVAWCGWLGARDGGAQRGEGVGVGGVDLRRGGVCGRGQEECGEECQAHGPSGGLVFCE